MSRIGVLAEEDAVGRLVRQAVVEEVRSVLRRLVEVEDVTEAERLDNPVEKPCKSRGVICSERAKNVSAKKRVCMSVSMVIDLPYVSQRRKRRRRMMAATQRSISWQRPVGRPFAWQERSGERGAAAARGGSS